jgi:hypothetical protein
MELKKREKMNLSIKIVQTAISPIKFHTSKRTSQKIGVLL